MKRLCNRLISTLLLALCLTVVPLSLMASPVKETGQQVSAAATVATEQVAAETAHGDKGAAPKEAAAHGEKGGHEAGAITKEKLNDLFWRVVNFVVLVLLLVKFTAKPLGDTLSARRQKVRDEIEGLEARRQDAEKAYQELVAKLADIEKDIKEIVDRAVVQAEKERVRIIEAAEKSAADLTRQAEMAVQKELLDAKRLLRDEMADRAAAMAEEIIKKSLTPDDQIRIVDQYLSKVEAVQ
jgi:F-type H+-transporting ATPase subunit b